MPIRLILNHNKSYQQGADFYFLKTPCTIIDDIDSKFFDDKDLNYKKNCPKVFDEDIENICLNFFKDIYGVSFKELKNLFCEYVKERKEFSCFEKKDFLNVLYNQLGLEKNSGEIFINKFLLDKTSYKKDIFNSKRNNRLYKRFFLYTKKKFILFLQWHLKI